MLSRKRWGAARTAALALLTTALAACSDEPTSTAPMAAGPGAPTFALSGACAILLETGDYSPNPQAQLNDFGRILADADNASCAENAATVLRNKLVNTRNANYDWFGDEWIDGNFVAMVLAAADRIGAHGYMTASLDSSLKWVASTFEYVPEPDGGCGLSQTDNCLDGYSAVAAGYAWIAAYHYRHDDPASATAARNDAKTYIDNSFASVCLRRVNAGVGPLCQNGQVTPDSVRQGTAQTWSWNLGYQFPAYGFGLMTSIAAAVLGLEGSGQGYSFSQANRDVAVGLFEETRRVVDATPTPDVWPTCVRPVGSGSSWDFTASTAFCGGPDPHPYQPQMYALQAFYQAELNYVPPPTGYQSSSFHEGHFDRSSSPEARGAFHGYGRYVFYGDLGYRWWTQRRGYQPLDANQPRGYLDRIDGGRVAQGWACDQDASSKAVRVELRVAGKVVMGLANQPSESAINTQCGGGSAHRFSIQLPTGTVGYSVAARALDYTYGFTDLACSQPSCVVPPAPTVDVAWVQPAEVSWGPANTLTAAGHAAGGTGGVRLEWRDITFTSSPPWNAVPAEPAPDANNTWSNTIPVANYCHTIQARATYFGVTSSIFTYRGPTSGHCKARVIWIQPSSTAGWGTPGALVVAGEARGAPAGTTVTMWWRNVSTGGPWVKAPYSAPTDANGIWIHDIPNANYSQQYQAYVKYDVITSSTCTYAGGNNVTWC